MKTTTFGNVDLYSFFKSNKTEYYKNSETTAVKCESFLIGPDVRSPVWTGTETINSFCYNETVETGVRVINSALGTMHFNEDGKLHNNDGPAFTSTRINVIEFYHNGVLHRSDGPASITNYGDYYYIYGKRIYNPLEYWIYVEKNN